jgi:hypothetical protein
LYMTRRRESTANDARRNGEHRKMAETDGFEPIKRPQRHLSPSPPPLQPVCTPSCTPDDGGNLSVLRPRCKPSQRAR